MRDDVLVVAVGDERLGLRAGIVAEVIRPKPLSRIPHAPDAMLGVANLRGAVLPVVSLRRLRGAAAGASGPATRIVVLDHTPPFGLLVDAVVAMGEGGAVTLLDPAALTGGLVAGPAPGPRPARPDPHPAQAAAHGAGPAGNDTVAILSFTVAGQWFGLPLDEVIEVVPVPPDAIAVPGLEGAVAATAGVGRAGVMPLVEARTLLGQPMDRGLPGTVVVVRLEGGPVGLVVDRVATVVHAPVTAIEPVPAILARGGREARVRGICRLEGGRRLLSLLSAGSLLAGTRMRGSGGTAPAGAEATHAAGDAQERFVVFDLGHERYGLPLAVVVEVVRLGREPTRVPNAPSFVRGVVTRRGRALPVIEAGGCLGARTGASPGGAARRRRVIVVDLDGTAVGLVVDGVSAVRAIRAGTMLPAPDLGEAEAALFDGVLPGEGEDRLVLVVNPGRLLARAEREALALMGRGAPKREPRGAARTARGPA